MEGFSRGRGRRFTPAAPTSLTPGSPKPLTGGGRRRRALKPFARPAAALASGVLPPVAVPLIVATAAC